MGRAVAPSLTRSSWIRWKSNLVRNNVNETSFIVVRHPFERLVSAYRDKLERTHAKNYLTDWYFKQYGQKIVKKYRSKAISIFGSDFFRYEVLLIIKNLTISGFIFIKSLLVKCFKIAFSLE